MADDGDVGVGVGDGVAGLLGPPLGEAMPKRSGGGGVTVSEQHGRVQPAIEPRLERSDPLGVRFPGLSGGLQLGLELGELLAGGLLSGLLVGDDELELVAFVDDPLPPWFDPVRDRSP